MKFINWLRRLFAIDQEEKSIIEAIKIQHEQGWEFKVSPRGGINKRKVVNKKD